MLLIIIPQVYLKLCTVSLSQGSIYQCLAPCSKVKHPLVPPSLQYILWFIEQSTV